MLWIYGIIGAVTGLITGTIFYLMTKHKIATSLLAGIAIVLAITATKKYVMPTYYAQAFEQNVTADSPFMELLAKKSPQQFKIYVNKVKQNILDRGDKSNEIYYAAELINSVLIEYGPKASTDSLFEFLQANLALDKKLIAIDPFLVLTMEFPEKFKGKTDPTLFNIGGDTQALLNAKIAVISSGMQDPQPPLNEEDRKRAAELLTTVIKELAQKYGEKTIAIALTKPDDPSVDKKIVAEIIISFYQTIINKGKDDATLMLRFMFMNNAKNQQSPS